MIEFELPFDEWVVEQLVDTFPVTPTIHNKKYVVKKSTAVEDYLWEKEYLEEKAERYKTARSNSGSISYKVECSEITYRFKLTAKSGEICDQKLNERSMNSVVEYIAMEYCKWLYEDVKVNKHTMKRVYIGSPYFNLTGMEIYSDSPGDRNARHYSYLHPVRFASYRLYEYIFKEVKDVFIFKKRKPEPSNVLHKYLLDQKCEFEIYMNKKVCF